MRRILSVSAIGALALLAACDQRSDAQRAAHDAGRPMEMHGPVHFANAGGVRVSFLRMPMRDGTKTLWIVEGSTVSYDCGKGCNDTVMHIPSGPNGQPPRATVGQLTPEVLAAIEKLTPDERIALGLPDPNDPRLTGIAKLSVDERRALGLAR